VGTFFIVIHSDLLLPSNFDKNQRPSSNQYSELDPIVPEDDRIDFEKHRLPTASELLVEDIP
jgi:hypothetical protein